jgi:hypothetical protein
MGSMFKKAEKRRAKFAIIIGESELETNTVNIKNMDTKEQVTIALEQLVQFLDINLSEAHHEHECCCGHDHEDGECCCGHDHEDGECCCEGDEDHECCCGHHHN